MAPDPEAPPPHAEGEPLEAPAAERTRLVGSPQALAAHDALVALTKAARSFTLYDPANKVVRKLIGEYREKTRHVLDTHGALVLTVHPYELLLGEEVVYKDADRERSLAFRLFRDGIRRLQFERATTWDELVRLLQILSIAFTAIRQQEDDLVTLLRKAGFDHIRITAIEGFLPEEEQTEASLVAATHRAGQERRDPPAHWDLPLPPLKEATPLRYRTVPEELLDRLRAEEAATTVAPEAVRLSLELLRLGGGTDLEAETAFALEAREFLIVEERADLVGELARRARPMLARVPGAAEAFVDALLDQRTLQALVGGIPPDAEALPPALTEILQGAGGEVVGRLLDLLIAEGSGPRAALLRRLVAHSCGVSSDVVVARLPETEGVSRVALMQLLVEVDPAAALQAAKQATTSEEEAVQLEALRQLQATELTPEIARALRHLVESPLERVRLSALPVMAERGKARVMPTLLAHAEKRHASLSAAEAAATGRALATSSPRGALDTFKGWLELKGGGLLGRKTLGAPATLQRVALAGLERIGGEEADALLDRLAERGEGEVRAKAETLIERRQGGGRGSSE
jgi:hypothetical protein